jgi:hypothetical protein
MHFSTDNIILFNERCRLKLNIHLLFVSILRMTGAVHLLYVVIWCCLIDPLRIKPPSMLDTSAGSTWIYLYYKYLIIPVLSTLVLYVVWISDLLCMSRECYVPGKNQENNKENSETWSHSRLEINHIPNYTLYV